MRRQGVTLLEVLVTMAVVAVMAAMSAVGFIRASQASRQAGAVKEVFALVQQARTEARVRNQAVRFDVTRVGSNNEVRWGRLPCGDALGRTCPGAACVSTTRCEGSCTCERQSRVVVLPAVVTHTNLEGLCLLGGSGQPRGAACDGSAAAVSTLRFVLPGETAPWLIVLEPLTGNPRLVDCARLPKDPSCP